MKNLPPAYLLQFLSDKGIQNILLPHIMEAFQTYTPREVAEALARIPALPAPLQDLLKGLELFAKNAEKEATMNALREVLCAHRIEVYEAGERVWFTDWHNNPLGIKDLPVEADIHTSTLQKYGFCLSDKRIHIRRRVFAKVRERLLGTPHLPIFE